MSNKALIEYSNDIQPLYEAYTSISGDKTKKLKLFGTAVVCNTPGINGRAYPLEIIDREAKRYTEKYINNFRSFSELNHPRLDSEGRGKDYPVVEFNLLKTCCMIESLYIEGENLKCKMKVIDKHPAGAALKALVEDGLRPGFSLRGIGSLEDSGRGYYQVSKDYKLISVDVVGNPSFDDDAISDSLYESMKEGKIINYLTESLDNNINSNIVAILEEAENEFMLNVGNIAKTNIMCGRKQINKNALVQLCNVWKKVGKKTNRSEYENFT